jgi:short subunit dehydrogenase-like uncharacterized protein
MERDFTFGIVGGYGAAGRVVAEELCKSAEGQVLIGGRDVEKAGALVKAGVHFSAEATDAVAFLEELRRRGVTVEEKLEQSNESERLT